MINILNYYVTNTDNEGKEIHGDLAGVVILKKIWFCNNDLLLVNSSDFPRNLLESSSFKNSIFNNLYFILKGIFNIKISDICRSRSF